LTPEITIMVLVAALLHAMWNALVKKASDRLLVLSSVALGQFIVGVVLIPFVRPPNPNLRPLKKDLLDLPRINIFTAGDDHIIQSIHDIEVSILIHGPDIAASEPFTPESGLRFLRLVVISLHDVAAADADLPFPIYYGSLTCMETIKRWILRLTP